jgi:hypothetical protein
MAYPVGEGVGVPLWCQHEAGPYRTIPRAAASWQSGDDPQLLAHEFSRGGMAQLLWLFHPATGGPTGGPCQASYCRAPHCSAALAQSGTRQIPTAQPQPVPLPVERPLNRPLGLVAGVLAPRSQQPGQIDVVSLGSIVFICTARIAAMLGEPRAQEIAATGGASSQQSQASCYNDWVDVAAHRGQSAVLRVYNSLKKE